MYSMNWVTYNFMRGRHVSMQGTLWGGGGTCRYCACYAVVSATTAFSSPQFKIREVVARDVIVWGIG